MDTLPLVEGWGRPAGPSSATAVEASTRVRESRESGGSLQVELLDDSGEPVEVVCGFLRFLAARDCSPNTLVSYAYDLRHLWLFFASSGLTWERFGPPDSIALLEYLRSVPSRRPRRRMTLSVVTVDADGPATKLAESTVNRILAAVSSFYEYAILSGLVERANPLEKRPDPALGRVSERHRPFMGRASRQRPVRRAVRVKTCSECRDRCPMTRSRPWWHSCAACATRQSSC
jgi:hypothetical protein